MDGPRTLGEYLHEFGDTRLPLPPTPERSIEGERRAIDAYCERWTPEWASQVESYAERLPPMSPGIRVAALAPARMEQIRISGLLEGLVHDISSLGPNSNALELVILENWLEHETRDDTAGVVTSWLARHDGLRVVHLLAHEFHPSTLCRLAYARKLLADVAVLRSRRRHRQSGPLYLLSEDADVTDIESGRTQTALRILDACPWLDGLRGPQERSLHAMKHNALLLLERRSWQFTELLLSSTRYQPHLWPQANFYWNRVVTAGSNVFLSAEAYALIRGYSSNVPLFEDMDIGQRLSVLRGQYSGSRFIPNVTTVQRFPSREESDASRAMLSLRDSAHIYDDGDPDATFYCPKHEQAVRTSGVTSLLQSLSDVAMPHDRSIHRFEAILTSLFREVYRILRDEDRTHAVFQRVMYHLGFRHADFVVSDDSVSVHCHSGFRRNVARVRRTLTRLEYRNCSLRQ